MAIRAFTVAERPELVERGIPAESVWPEYNLHGVVTSRLWPRLHTDLPRFQFGLCDEGPGELVAQGRTVPCWWDGTDEALSSGVDETLQEAFAALDAGGPVNTLCAMAAEIPPQSRGRGLARAILQAMAAIAEKAGLEHLIAPVRPSMKDRYPITPIERYAMWRRADGRLFDPWMRVHETRGARVGPTIPRSLRIAGTVSEWEAWTGLAFPDSGAFVFPQGLAPVAIDRDGDVGTYWEPNVWMIHR
ncbi:MAG TPA: hypothetical protein VM324_01855 [Egibacteraceae bacterium]|nr:hypothetical protein [Egibacteraceae bacterium]